MSIKNHEVVTHDYTYKELNYYIPLIVSGLKTKIGIEQAISTPQIIDGLYNYERKEKGNATKIRPERIRMMVRHIVVNDLVPGLISGGKGYYIATMRNEMDEGIKSLDERINAIEAKRKAWIRQRDSKFIEANKLFAS